MSDWPAETPLFWQEVADIAAQQPITEHYKTDLVVTRVPLYGWRMTAYDVVYFEEISQFIGSLGSLTAKRYAKGLKERRDGHTEQSYQNTIFTPTSRLVDVSVWTLKGFHHWLTLKNLGEQDISSYDHIVEIGGGIGETARVLFDTFGFKGKYTIVDLPPILQYSKRNLQGYNVSFTDDYTTIEPQPKTLLFSTWGLSEIDLTLRNSMIKHIQPSSLFVTFQGRIFGVDNREYFMRKYPSMYNMSIRVKTIPFHTADGGNFYLYAKQRD